MTNSKHRVIQTYLVKPNLLYLENGYHFVWESRIQSGLSLQKLVFVNCIHGYEIVLFRWLCLGEVNCYAKCITGGLLRSCQSFRKNGWTFEPSPLSPVIEVSLKGFDLVIYISLSIPWIRTTVYGQISCDMLSKHPYMCKMCFSRYGFEETRVIRTISIG